jgi:hypothetical protein
MNAPRYRPFYVVLLPAIALFSFASQSYAQIRLESSLSCTTTTVGRIPINDLGTGLYQGHQGGLYPGGVNQPPPSHLTGGLSVASLVQPRDTLGNVDLVNGKIVLLSIGMSNATQEFSVFKSMADTFAARNPKLVIVDGAQGGQTAAIISNPNANFWTVVRQRLQAAGVAPRQVQAAWVKEADANPTQAFPRHAQILDSEFVLIARILKSFYPNIQVAYWSSRTYGGYATTTLNPEPYAYESGFAVKWTITRQINGDTALAYTGSNVRAPWLGWGAYLWADGLIPRSDGLIWECDDFVSTDRTHPSATGRRKVANMLLNFFKSDTTTKGWFLRQPPTDVHSTQFVHPTRFELYQNYPNPFNPTTTIKFQIPNSNHLTLKVFDLLGREVATLLNEAKPPGTYTIQWDARNHPSGMCCIRLSAGSVSRIMKAMVIK